MIIRICACGMKKIGTTPTPLDKVMPNGQDGFYFVADEH